MTEKPCRVCGNPTTKKMLGVWLHPECVKQFRSTLRDKKQVSAAQWIAVLRDADPRSTKVFLRVHEWGAELTDAASQATRWGDSVTAWRNAEEASERFAMAFKAIQA